MKVVDCDGVRDVLPEYVRGLGAAEERALVQGHLAACAECAAELRIVALLHASQTAVSPHLLERVLQATKAVPRSRRGMPRYAAAAAAVAALLGASVIARDDRLPAGMLQPGEATGALVEEAVGSGALGWLDHDPLVRSGIGLHDLSVEELEVLLGELES